MLDAVSKAFFSALARSGTLKRLASHYGMREGAFARRFIAGETTQEAIAAARSIEARRMMITLDYLGERVRTIDEANAATRAYLDVMDRVVEADIGRNLSVKLTQLGLDVDRATCVDNLRRILEPGERHGFFVRIDMESSSYTDVTLDIFETIWQQGCRGVGIVLQSCLRRSASDLERVNGLGARIRLVKGAYKEPASIAFQKKHEVDTAFVTLMKRLITGGTYPAIATHDPAMIEATRAFAGERGIPRQTFEFQMLYGVRRDLQAALTDAGYPFRVYVPFGREWFPYFMRRLGERPANVGFVIRSLVRER